jgi:hypothetical protein
VPERVREVGASLEPPVHKLGTNACLEPYRTANPLSSFEIQREQFQHRHQMSLEIS